MSQPPDIKSQGAALGRAPAALAAPDIQPAAPARVCSRRVAALRTPAQFDAVFQRGRRYRSAHFALHLLAETRACEGEPSLALGFIVPKRQARRAARRNLVRRLWREAVRRWVPSAPWPGQCWLVVRLTAAWTTAEGFRSQQSPALRQALRSEIDALLRQVRPGASA